MQLRRRRHATGARAVVPPERIELDGIIVTRLTVDDADVVSAAAVESLEHLRPWMPWATAEGTSPEAQRERLLGPASAWNPGSDYGFGIFLPDGRLVGGIGLHRRIGRSALEIGYWVHVDHVRQGIATAAAAALTTEGFALRGIERMEIHCDVANEPSAAVPRRLGYTLTARLAHEPEAPGETGVRLIWVVYRREWEARLPAAGPDDS